MTRDELELLDSYQSLWINPIKNLQLNWSKTINIIIWGIHQETNTIAKAISLCKSEVEKETDTIINIVIIDMEWDWKHVFDWKDFITCKTPQTYDFSLYNSKDNTLKKGNAIWFERYTDNKFLTSIILKINNIKVPSEIIFHKKWNKSWTNKQKVLEIEALLWDNNSFVLKPFNLESWKWVHMLKKEDLNEEFYDKYLKNHDTILIQEKIESYPIVIDSIKKDWNLRVLVTYDYDSRKYISTWIIWRIDNDWVPVSISLTAEYISFEQISELIWLSETDYLKLKNDIEQTAIKSVTTIWERIWKNKEMPNILINSQSISGIDIIINKNLEPVVIEVNSANSGWIYQLMKFDWIESIFPIAQSILFKTILLSEIENS